MVSFAGGGLRKRTPKRAPKRTRNRTPNRTPNGTLETTLTWSEAFRRLVAFHVVVIVGLLGVLGGGGGKAFAFVVPQSLEVGAGSQWVYESNLGTAHVRMLERVAIGPELERYRWEMRIGVLHYVEDAPCLGVFFTATEREVGGFGLIKQRFFYDEPELVLTATLEVGTRWEWNGHVRQGSEVREATAKGEVLAYHPIVVPAGEPTCTTSGLSERTGLALAKASIYGLIQTLGRSRPWEIWSGRD